MIFSRVFASLTRITEMRRLAHLNSNNGNYFDLDPIKLVEAAPTARLHQTRENPAD